MNSNELPFGTQFSPAIVDLGEVLRLASENDGKSIAEFVEILADQYWPTSPSKKKLAGNLKISLTSYGLITDSTIHLTEFGLELYALNSDSTRIKSFAKRILLFLNGLRLIETLRQLDLNGVKATNSSVNQALIEQGFELKQNSNNAQVMKLWLEKANVLHEDWRIDEVELVNLLGIKSEDIGPFKDLTPEQYYFLLALTNAATEMPLVATDVRNLATASYNIVFDEKAFAQKVIKPLQAKGLIIAEKTTEGRGAKPYMVQLSETAKQEVVGPLLEQFRSQVGNALAEAYCKTFVQLREEIDSEDTYKKGLALEAFSIKVMRIIGLNFVKTRYRDIQIGGAEVDALFDSTRLYYSRWQVQCKNTSVVTIDMVAKEVGLTHMLKSNVIVMMTTGHLTSEAKKYIRRIMEDMNLCILTLQKEDIDKIIENPTSIVQIFNIQAENAKKIKFLHD